MTCPDPTTQSGYDPSFCIGGSQGTYDCSVYIEAMQGDNGQNKAANPQWWLSNDLYITDTMGNPVIGDAVAGQNYLLNVRPHLSVSSNAACTLSASGSSYVTVDLYIGPAGLVPTAPKITSLNLGPSNFASDPAYTGLVPKPPQQFTWSPSVTGHLCLRARCYPDALPGSPTSFYLPADPHSAQHNLTIDAAPKRAEGGRRYRFDVGTANQDNANAAQVTVRVATDPKPRQQVLDILMPQLQRVAGFKNIASLPPTRGFGLQLPDFPNAQVQDNTRLLALFGTGLLGIIWRFIVSLILIILGIFGIRYQPKYEVSFQMQPDQVTNFTFTTDLSDASPGDAFIFHLTHVENNVVKGGNTVVVVAI